MHGGLKKWKIAKCYENKFDESFDEKLSLTRFSIWHARNWILKAT